MSDSFDTVLDANRELLQRLSRGLEESRLRGERVASLQSNLDATSASVWSQGRIVRATVAASGLLTNLEYADTAQNVPATRLADLTVETIRRAMAAMQERIEELAKIAVGGELGQAISDEYRRSFADSLKELNDDSIGYAN